MRCPTRQRQREGADEQLQQRRWYPKSSRWYHSKRQQHLPHLLLLLMSMASSILLHAPCVHANANSDFERFLEAATTATRSSLDCDPCIARSDIRIRALLPSSVSHTDHEDFYEQTPSADAAKPTFIPSYLDWKQLQWRQLVRSMQQAAEDVYVELEIVYYDDTIDGTSVDSTSLQKFYKTEWNRANDDFLNRSGRDRLNALLVAVPPNVAFLESLMMDDAATAIQIPVFGMHAIPLDRSGDTIINTPTSARKTGNALPTLVENDNKLNIVSWVGHDEYLVGELATKTLLGLPATSEDFSFPTKTIRNIAFVTFESGAANSAGNTVEARYAGIKETLLLYSPITNIDRLKLTVPLKQKSSEVDEEDVNVKALRLWLSAFCKYDAIVIADLPSVPITLEALLYVKQNCDADNYQAVALDVSREIYTAITLEQLQFGIDVQYSLQSTLAIIQATLFSTTALKLNMPKNHDIGDEYYHKFGPIVITQDLIPTDSYVECQLDAFPVCDIGAFDTRNGGGKNDIKTTLLLPMHGNADRFVDMYDGVESQCLCIDREKEIRIGGVLHGVTTDGFWDVVFASAEQAGRDLGNIQLELERYAPPAIPASNVDNGNSTEDKLDITSRALHEAMAARISTLCASGVDGLFVTIPSEIVLPAIEQCLQLRVPVISVNSGNEFAFERSFDKYNARNNINGIFHHIGMDEYLSGYGAGERLIEAGMKRGFCFDHDTGNSAIADRCRGFEDSISDYNRQNENAAADVVVFEGTHAVAADNIAQYKVDVEQHIIVENDEDDWTGIGILLLGYIQVIPMIKVVENHPGKSNAVIGSFDVSPELYRGIEDGYILFGIDQQPFFQGNLPVHLLTYYAYTKQRILDFFIESGPSYVYQAPSDAQVVCQANHFEVCPEYPAEELHFIPTPLLILGYILTGILAFTCFIALGWTYRYRHKWAVQVSQPQFLALIAIGTLMSGMSIVFMGIQTTYRYQQDSQGELLSNNANPDIGFVDNSCMAGPWLYGIGFVVTFSALLAKIQRVKMIYEAGMQMQRKRVTLLDVVPVMIGMMMIELAILLSWQLIAPLRWQREELDEFEGFVIESVGSCTGGPTGWHFYLSLVLFHVVCLLYALVLCFQTKDISSDLAESSYVSLAVMFMFQVLVLAVPISALVQDNTDVFYFVRSSAVFLQNFTVMVLIFVPKMVRVHETQIASPNDNHLSAPGSNGRRVRNNANNSVPRRRSGVLVSSEPSMLMSGTDDVIAKSLTKSSTENSKGTVERKFYGGWKTNSIGQVSEGNITAGSAFSTNLNAGTESNNSNNNGINVDNVTSTTITSDSNNSMAIGARSQNSETALSVEKPRNEIHHVMRDDEMDDETGGATKQDRAIAGTKGESSHQREDAAHNSQGPDKRQQPRPISRRPSRFSVSLTGGVISVPSNDESETDQLEPTQCEIPASLPRDLPSAASVIPTETTSPENTDEIVGPGYESMFLPNEVKRQWRELGFLSEDQATAAIQLVSLETPFEVRKELIEKLGGLS